MRYGVTVLKDRTKQFKSALSLLTRTRVLVGFPAADDEREGAGMSGRGSRDERDQSADDKSQPLNNATIGYLMNTGMPERNVPAREFMASGIKRGQAELDAKMQQVATVALTGEEERMQKGYIAMGLIAQTNIRNKITEGIPPPLADSTIEARLARVPSRKGEAAELAHRAAGGEPTLDITPLVDTGQLRNAVNFVVRTKGT